MSDPDPSSVLTIAVAGLRGLPGVMGGIESHCEELYPRIVALDKDVDITCVARRPYVEQKVLYSYRGIKVLPLPSTRRVSIEALLNTTMSVLYFGLVRRPDVLHIHAIGPGLLSILAKLLGLRLVVTHHGRDYRRAKWKGMAKFSLRAGEWASLRFADRVIAVSETLCDELRAEYPRRKDRIQYVPNGAPVNRVATSGDVASLVQHGLVPGGYIVSVGRLVPEKGFQDLIAAHAQSGTTLPLVIVGGADHESDFVRSLHAQASGHVIFTGLLPRETVLDYCAHCALFVLASHHEGLPIAALEAAAVGAPLLLSDIDANRDVQLRPENYFPVGDVDALAQRLGSSFAGLDSETQAVIERFDWDKVAAQTLGLYRQMVSAVK